MCEAVGHPVVRLVRTRIGPLTDRTLAPGAWRSSTPDEVPAALYEPRWPAPTDAIGRARHSSGHR